MKKTKKFIVPFAIVTLITASGIGAVSYASLAQAQTNAPTTISTPEAKPITKKVINFKKGNTLSGTVASIDGNIITFSTKASKIYTVDVTNAKILKKSDTVPVKGQKIPAPKTITISDIKIGDTITVHGTKTGTSIIATSVLDGKIAPLKKEVKKIKTAKTNIITNTINPKQ